VSAMDGFDKALARIWSELFGIIAAVKAAPPVDAEVTATDVETFDFATWEREFSKGGES
jgi:hypothetical protein